jgi:hypothetical protein
MNYWLVDYARKNEGIIELKSIDSNFRYYVRKSNIEEIKRGIKAIFMSNEEEKNQALNILNHLYL